MTAERSSNTIVCVLEIPETSLRLPIARDVVLRDGSTVHVRAIDGSDEQRMCEFLRDLSPDSRAFRFLSLGVDVARAARQAVDVDGARRVGLLATGPGVGRSAPRRPCAG